MSALTIRQCADELGVHPATIWRCVRYGAIEAFKVGRVYRITAASFADFKRRIAYTPPSAGSVPFGGFHADHLIDKTKPVS